eukprot:TRINITY_DN32802_c0_g1_i1.p1 TRINITY_DN32802_c0_g1~~TRINITY_DN32802_c0_g1_i1.p1  ORF type:complete len:519 (-),score=54.62 TRINITY_DN32802_c0_g1_i1:496-1971(-)
MAALSTISAAAPRRLCVTRPPRKGCLLSNHALLASPAPCRVVHPSCEVLPHLAGSLGLSCYATTSASAHACLVGCLPAQAHQRRNYHGAGETSPVKETDADLSSADSSPHDRWTELLRTYNQDLFPAALPLELTRGSSYRGQNLAFLGERLLDVQLWKHCGLAEADDDVMGEFNAKRSAVLSHENLSDKAHAFLGPTLADDQALMRISPIARARFFQAVVGRLSEVAPPSCFETAMKEVMGSLCSEDARGSRTTTFEKVRVDGVEENLGFKQISTSTTVTTTEASSLEAWQEFLSRSETAGFNVEHFNVLAARTSAPFTVRGFKRRFEDQESACMLQLMTTNSDNMQVTVLGASLESAKQASFQAASKLLETVTRTRLAQLCGVPDEDDEEQPASSTPQRWNLPKRVFDESKHPRMAIVEINHCLGASTSDRGFQKIGTGYCLELVWESADGTVVKAFGSGSSKKECLRGAYEELLASIKHLQNTPPDTDD